MKNNLIYSKFDIETQFSDSLDSIVFPPTIRFAVIGDDADDRCRIVHAELAKKYRIIRISYDADTFIVSFDGHKREVDDFLDLIRIMAFGNFEILIDCTSVNEPELLLFIGALYECGVQHFSSLYLEPKYYSCLQKMEIGSERKFELSNSYLGYKGIPGYLLSLDAGDSVAFCCGYENERIMNAFEYHNISSKYVTLLFGMPPFNAGWDMNSYENHVSFIDDQSIKKIDYCGATNPLAVIKRLDEMYLSLQEEEKLFIAPLGTKPMSLGACLFVVVCGDRERVALLYDHPIKKQDRSHNTGKWHLYNINIA